MKSCKAPGLDGFPVECLTKGGMAVLEWQVRLLNHRIVSYREFLWTKKICTQ